MSNVKANTEKPKRVSILGYDDSLALRGNFGLPFLTSRNSYRVLPTIRNNKIRINKKYVNKDSDWLIHRWWQPEPPEPRSKGLLAFHIRMIQLVVFVSYYSQQCGEKNYPDTLLRVGIGAWEVGCFLIPYVWFHNSLMIGMNKKVEWTMFFLESQKSESCEHFILVEIEKNHVNRYPSSTQDCYHSAVGAHCT